VTDRKPITSEDLARIEARAKPRLRLTLDCKREILPLVTEVRDLRGRLYDEHGCLFCGSDPDEPHMLGCADRAARIVAGGEK